jgi:hypothetical protein
MDTADRFNPIDYPLAMTWPRLLTPASSWVGHTPFAMALVELCRPDRFVELGTLNGDSYCAFCQAVDALKLPTRCTAVDTWAGDPHAGNYGPQVLQALREHHDPLYSQFSNLLQATFEDALKTVPDGSVDLLHIDGFHSYDAVKHDFDTWQPKLSERGIVLFHDTQVRGSGFGVWSFWAEQAAQFPNFEFHHSYGLGVLAVGSKVPQPVLRFLEIANREADVVRTFFKYLGDAVDWARTTATLLDHTYHLQEMLNKRKQMIGEAVTPGDVRQAFNAPLRFIQQMMYDVQAVTVSDLKQRGFNVQAGPPPGQR